MERSAMNETAPSEAHPALEAQAESLRKSDPSFASWARGYGVIAHSALTQVRVHDLAARLTASGQWARAEDVYALLAAGDRLASAGLWLVSHMTYARHVRTDGRALEADDFKPEPEGHTGGSLNMVMGYAGYMAANALTGLTRSWLMGQGHCVAAIDALNLLADNMSPEQEARYAYSDEGLSRFVQDFYSYETGADGRAASPLGSHVNPHTAGGLMEGGYLGFAQLLYPHMPLPGERLVAFLSDGAFEEQRGGDWAPRWWRCEDSGPIAPIMIANGRRIDQRTTMAQVGGVAWLRDHLRLNGFDPIDIDGRDPAAFAWAIIEMEERLSACQGGPDASYPFPLPYAIAEAPKGFGLPGAGSNPAHNLPLAGAPFKDEDARRSFNDAAARLFVPEPELKDALSRLNNHGAQKRPKERDHPLIARPAPEPVLPEPVWAPEGSGPLSPMQAVDQTFVSILKANPGLRPRVGNPDEMRSNKLDATLDLLRHRVSSPEEGVAESIDGAVITALNEEAVVCAALGNKGGINLVATYEAFGVKMLGALRQEIIFARHQIETGRQPNWLSVPVMLTSHTWENGKNEQSHQDTTLAETLMGEMSDMARVLFPADWNSAAAVTSACYRTTGRIWGIVAPKRPVARHFTPQAARRLVEDGAARVRGDADNSLIIAACGAYQLEACLKAADRLALRGQSCSVVYMLEPARFRAARDRYEAAACAPDSVSSSLFPAHARARVFAVHCRPEVMAGVLRPLDTGQSTRFLGYINRGGTLDMNGMFFANRTSWAHIAAAAAETAGGEAGDVLTDEEIEAVRAERAPAGVLW